MKSRRVFGVCVLTLLLAGCAGPKSPSNPPRLVSSNETDLSIQLFMQATILLGRYYGFDKLDYEAVREKSTQAGFETLPFMQPQIKSAVPSFKRASLKPYVPSGDDDPRGMSVAAYQRWVHSSMGYNNLVKYYISTGLRASQMVCRNFLQGLDERNRYLNFLRAEFGVFNTLADGVLSAVDANGTLRDSFAMGRTFASGIVNAYEDYRFLKVEYEQVRFLVETAQSQLAQHEYTLVDGSQAPQTVSGRTIYKMVYTFPDALNAVSRIEAQCTRAGIDRLLTKATYAAPSNMTVDPITGELIFRSNGDAVADSQQTLRQGIAPQTNPAPNNSTGNKGNTPPVAAVGAAPIVAAPDAGGATPPN